MAGSGRLPFVVGTDLGAVAQQLPPGVRIRTAGDADLEAMVEFRNRWGTPTERTSPDAARAMQNLAPEPLRLALIAETADRQIVGVGTVSDGGIFRSGDGSWRVYLRVVPEQRRHGIGSAMLAQLEAHARKHGAPRIVASTRGSDPDGARFAEARGYRAFHERIDAWIDVPAFDASSFEDPDATARRAGVRLVTWEELRREQGADIEKFENEMVPILWAIGRDVPSPTPMPEQPPPLEQARRMFFEGQGMDAPTSILALRDGALIGVSVTTLKENGVAYTNFTGVVRTERGKGIALAMKLRALRALKERGIRLFGTTNDEQNAAMRGINRRLGYRPDPPTTVYEKRFT